MCLLCELSLIRLQRMDVRERNINALIKTSASDFTLVDTQVSHWEIFSLQEAKLIGYKTICSLFEGKKPTSASFLYVVLFHSIQQLVIWDNIFYTRE